jgi:predicted HicB family RNase H-like nuclease
MSKDLANPNENLQMPFRAEEYMFHVRWSLEEEQFLASVSEFSDISAYGATQLIAIQNAVSLVEQEMSNLISKGSNVPEPIGRRQFSGKVNIRMPHELHRLLALEAIERDVSLNQLIVNRLSSGNNNNRKIFLAHTYWDSVRDNISICTPDMKFTLKGKVETFETFIQFCTTFPFGLGKPDKEKFSDAANFNLRRRELLLSAPSSKKRLHVFIEGLIIVSADLDLEDLTATRVDLYGRGPDFGAPDVPEGVLAIRGEFIGREGGWHFTVYTRC